MDLILLFLIVAFSVFVRSLPNGLLETRATPNGFSDAPNSNFIRRTHQSSTILGTSVIIDGGDIAWGSLEDYTNYPMEDTLILDMSQSWVNSTVKMITVPKNGAPSLNNQLLWPSSNNKNCFAYGGDISQAVTPNISAPPSNGEFWEFELDGNNGSWTQFLVPYDRTIFNTSFWRTTNGLGTTLANTGFSVGGYAYRYTSTQSSGFASDVYIPGIATFNMTSGMWTNDTAPWGITNSFLASVPNFGPSGLLLSSGSSGTGTQSQSLDNLTIYEPIGKTWHTQTLTGKTPTARQYPCSVGINGDNGTYEIFVYGGQSFLNGGGTLTSQQEANNNALDEVWVLSLPAFAWFKANYTAQVPRIHHTCQVVGNRQMLSIGGASPNDYNYGYWSRDSFAQGLGVFDLTEMEWKSGYDANATPYTTPQVVKDWYSNNPPPKFDDPAVAALFNAATSTNKSATSTSTPIPSPPKASSAGVIAGGVIGGLAGLALILALAFYFLRRHSRWGPFKRRSPLDVQSSPIEKSASQRRAELMNEEGEFSELHDGKQDGLRTPEMEAVDRFEIAGSDALLPELHDGQRPSGY